MQESMKYEYQIPTMDLTVAGEASSHIKKILRQIGIDAGIIRRVAIATYEAEINIAIHSMGGTLTLLISEDWVKIIAKDVGPGIENIDLAMQKGFSTATSEIRELGFGAGMGLPNMQKCADDFQITSEFGAFTRVEMTMML